MTLTRDADGVARYVDSGVFASAHRCIDNDHRQPRVAVMESRRDNQALGEEFKKRIVVTPIILKGMVWGASGES